MLNRIGGGRWEAGETEASKPPTTHALHSGPLSFFFLGFLPFAQSIFCHQNLIKDFACLISKDKCSQNSSAIAEAELACGKGTASLFEIRISKGIGL